MQLYTLKICKHFLKTFPETTYICYQLKQIANHEAFDFFFYENSFHIDTVWVSETRPIVIFL